MATGWIRFSCLLCGKSLKAPSEVAGKTGKCSRCATPCIVPSMSMRVESRPRSSCQISPCRPAMTRRSDPSEARRRGIVAELRIAAMCHDH